jgi:acyl carrier protein
MTDTAHVDTARGQPPSHTQVHAVVAAMAPHPTAAGDLDGGTRLVADLAYDSVRLIELTIALEKHFGLPALEDSRLATVTTVGEVADLVAAQLGETR